MTRKRRRGPGKRDDIGVYCPRCRRPMNGQYDTETEELIWWCEHCEMTFDVSGQEETFYMTSAIDPEGYKTRAARERAAKLEVPS